MCVFMSVCALECRYSREPDGSVGSPGVTEGCESFNVGAGN